jgi:hypothetical protein
MWHLKWPACPLPLSNILRAYRSLCGRLSEHIFPQHILPHRFTLLPPPPPPPIPRSPRQLNGVMFLAGYSRLQYADVTTTAAASAGLLPLTPKQLLLLPPLQPLAPTTAAAAAAGADPLPLTIPPPPPPCCCVDTTTPNPTQAADSPCRSS